MFTSYSIHIEKTEKSRQIPVFLLLFYIFASNINLLIIKIFIIYV